jgi:hypothetical protein
MRRRNVGSTTTILLLALALVACARWNGDEAPAGFAIVREHTISAARNDPPISSTLDYTITAIDEKAVIRETVPRWVDIQRGALISTGSHTFKVLAMPPMYRPGDIAKEDSFTATVGSGKVYFLVDKNGQPVLIEARSKKE